MNAKVRATTTAVSYTTKCLTFIYEDIVSRIYMHVYLHVYTLIMYYSNTWPTVKLADPQLFIATRHVPEPNPLFKKTWIIMSKSITNSTK